MAGNIFGDFFRITTFGESHGRAVGVIIDGVPPNLPLSEEDIQKELDRRRPGQSSITTPRQESDRVEILSGIFQGRTMGPPVAMLIRNRNQDPSAYEAFKEKFRPGHADYTYFMKYGVRDWRGSGRASGRETAARVAAGAVAKKVLGIDGIEVLAFTREIAGIRAESVDYDQIEKNPVRTADPAVVDAMISAIQQARQEEDSVGGIAELHIRNCPPGLGDPVFAKLEARLGAALLSIGAVKAVEFGAGFEVSRMKGSQYNDAFEVRDGRISTRTNHCGGIIGGISTGADIVVRCAIRPPASIARVQETVNLDQEETDIEVHGRHDPCIVPRAIPVIEAMAAITLVDALLCQQAYRPYLPSQEEGAALIRKPWQSSP
ncbi:MAG: chorismate synthase [Lentisphaerae bacterium]|nr:MAG: chorismate synthase [Lentisphaerota bacterium]